MPCAANGVHDKGGGSCRSSIPAAMNDLELSSPHADVVLRENSIEVSLSDAPVALLPQVACQGISDIDSLPNSSIE